MSQTEFPAGLDTPATSLLLRGARVKREDLLVELLEAIDSFMEVLSRHTEEILRRFVEASSLRPRPPRTRESGGPYT